MRQLASPTPSAPAVCSAHGVRGPAPTGAPLKSPQQTGWEMNEPGGTGTKGLRLVPTTRGARGHRALRATPGAECK